MSPRSPRSPDPAAPAPAPAPPHPRPRPPRPPRPRRPRRTPSGVRGAELVVHDEGAHAQSLDASLDHLDSFALPVQVLSVSFLVASGMHPSLRRRRAPEEERARGFVEVAEPLAIGFGEIGGGVEPAQGAIDQQTGIVGSAGLRE